MGNRRLFPGRSSCWQEMANRHYVVLHNRQRPKEKLLNQFLRGEGRAMVQQRRIFHKKSFEERLAQQAQLFNDQAKMLPPGKDREILLRRARQTEAAANINEWLTSPGLPPPKPVRP